MKTNPNDPAYSRAKSSQPDTAKSHWSVDEGAFGLSKREHFAAMAMQGLLATPADGQNLPSDFTLIVQQVTLAAVEYADALIAALNKKEGK